MTTTDGSRHIDLAEYLVELPEPPPEIHNAAMIHAQIAVAEQLERIANWLENWPRNHDDVPIVKVES